METKPKMDLEKSHEVTVAEPRKYEYVYIAIILVIYWHIAGFYGLYLTFTSAKWGTIFMTFIMYVASIIGFTAGSHRLWSHRAYKAKLPLEIILIVFQSLCYQHTVTEWVRNHRLHHKYSDTDADPHNASRGFFFSHIGWLMVKKHPLVKIKGKDTYMSDIYANPVLRFQKKYAVFVIGMIGYVLPTIIPVYFWGETFSNSWHITMMRYMLSLHGTFVVSSVAHIYGYKPYDKNIKPTEGLAVSLVCAGEGFHNFHHSFPWDYRAAELGNNWMNLTTKFIDFFAWIGWAYDLKTVNVDLIRSRANKFGDGTGIWGWGDKEQTKDNVDAAEIINEKREQ